MEKAIEELESRIEKKKSEIEGCCQDDYDHLHFQLRNLGKELKLRKEHQSDLENKIIREKESQENILKLVAKEFNLSRNVTEEKEPVKKHCKECGQIEGNSYNLGCDTCDQFVYQGFSIQADNPDDVTLYKDSKPILNISLPEKSTQWNTNLP